MQNREFLEVLWAESRFGEQTKTFTEFASTKECSEFHSLAMSLMKRARICNRLAIKQCNVGLTEAEQARDERNDDAIVDLANLLGIGLSIQGDPRGCTVKVRTPKTGRSNTLGGAEVGWGVPGS